MALAHFKALNVDSSDESESDAENPSITREALEEKAVGEYTTILLLQKNKQWEEAKEGLQKLLESEVLSRAAGSVTYVGGKLQPSLAHLKYCILTNLGQVLTELGKIKPAVDYYLEAVTLDDTDINLWYRIGKAAIKIPNLNLASYAFQEALRCNPNHWPSLDTLITVLYASGNYLLCLYYISEGLEKDNEFMKGIAFSQKIFDEHPSFIRDFPMYYPQCLLDEKLKEYGKIELDDPMYVSMFKEADALKSSFETLQWPRENRDVVVNNVKPERPLRKKSWIALGQCLLQVYSRLKEEYPEVSFYRLVDLSEDDINISSKTGNEVEEKDDILDDNLIDKEVDKINESQSENDNDTGSRSKRRRSSPSLSDQWMTFSKRRSARVRSTVRRDEPTLARTLHNLLPISLRPSKDDYKNNVDPVRWSEDSMDTMDLYRLFESKDGGVSQESNDQHIDIVNNTSDEERNRLIEKEKYFYCEKEVNDINLFIKKNNCRDILTLLNNYVRLLATKWKLWWPSHLTTVYLKIYKIIRLHSPENCQTSDSLDLSAAQAVLLYGELLLDYWLQRGKDLGLPSPITGSVFGGDFCTLIFGDFSYLCDDSEDVAFVVRCYWLEALMYLHAGSTESTMIALQRYMNDERCDNVQVKLLNIKNHYVINNDIIERLYNTLNRNESLSGIQKLFNNKNYEKVAEILMETLQPSIKLLNAEFVEPIVDRCTQFSLLLDSLFELERYEDCFIWCELCSHEAMNQCRTSLEDSSGNKSKWLILLTNTLQGLPYCIDHGGRDVIKKLPNNRLIRLIQTMSSIVCHQIESSDSADIPFETIFPWILLYEILKHYEDTSGRVIEDDVIPNSLTLLFTAHEYLGRRSWCCCDEAEILFKTLTVLLPIMESSNPDTDKMLILNQQMEQIFYCLYGHPIKRNRPRYVQEHNSMGLALTWSRSKLVYRFLKPRELPMYDSSARYSISLDVEVLFRRIVSLLPNENNPSHLVEKLNNYIEGTSNELPNNKNLLPEEIVDIYYLIADHYFKNKAWSKALKYYILDVCANPNRVDSWACLALARGSQLETKLNSCEPIKNEQDFLKRAKMSCRCYQRSLQLDPEQSTLWIEYGSFSYMVHSFCSRLLNQEQNLSLELFDILESQKNEMLQTASKCFTSANMLWTSYEKLGVEPEIQDERWLHHYMLGKIAEKKEEKPSVYLGHFMKSTKFLHLNNAKYPEHVSYSNPQLYSVEALELYYRIHACILKLVEQSEEQPLSDDLSRLFFEILERSACGPFVNFGKFIEYGNGNECDDFGNIEDISKGTPLIEIEANYVLNNILETISTDENETNAVTKKRKLSDVTSDNEVVENAEESDCKKLKTTDKPDTDEKELITDSENKVLQRQKSKESDSGNDLKNENSDDPSAKTENKSEDNKKVLKKEKSQDSSSETLSDTDTTSSDTDSSDDSSSSEDSNSSSSDSSQQNSSDEDKPPPSKKMKMSKPLRNWKEEQRCLIDRCLSAMEECVRRFPEHYKSIYRQAHYYFRSKVRSDNTKVRQLLLGEGGLFADRKPNHFFNGVWRIPSSEIDRPGSFAGHMSRCLHLLLDLLRDSRDHKMLLTLSLQLKDTPEPDKKYVRDEEREQIAKESVTLSAQAFRRKLHETHKSSEIQNVLNESYKYYKRINKFWPLRDSPFISLVTQCFVKYLKSKGETKYKSTFEAACRFCLDGTLIPLPPKIKTPPPPPPPPAPLLPPPPPPPVLQPEPIIASKQPSQIQFPVPPIQVMHPITVTTTSSSVAPSVLTGTTTNILPPTTINNPIVKGNNNQSNTKLGAPLKRPRGRPAGGSVRHPNPLSQMLKKEPNMPKDLQMLYKNLPYSHQQLMNMMRNPMFAMQAASVQQQFNQQVSSVQQELMRQIAINQQSAQKPQSSATIAASSMTPTPSSSLLLNNKNILPTTNTNLSSLGTMPKDHPNITITAVSPTATKSSSSVTQTQRSSNIKTSSAHSSILKSNVIKPQLTTTSKSVKRDVPSPLNISPPTSKSPVICSPNSLLKTNQSPILSPYNHPLPPQIPPLLSSQIRNSMSTLPIIASSPSSSGGSDMSLQHKLSAKRNKQSPPLLNPQMKEPITTDPSLFRYDHTMKDKSLTSPHHSFNKNLMDISKNNPNLNEANKYNISRSTTISKIQSKNLSDQKQLQKDLGLTISTVHNSELSNKLSSLSPKEITLTRLPQQNLTADINPNPGNSNIHQDPLKNKNKQMNVHHQIRQELSQIQHQQLPTTQYHHNIPSNIPTDYRKPPPTTTGSIVDNRISALKAIGTQLTITPSLSNTNNPELMKKQDVIKYPDRPEVTIAPAAAAAAAAASKDKPKKDACELILL